MKKIINIINKEILRSIKFKSRSSFIIIDLNIFIDNNKNNINYNYDKLIKKILHLISEKTRNYDIVFPIASYKIALILPNTSVETAKYVSERLLKGLISCFTFLNNEQFIEFQRRIILSIHPLNEIHQYIQLNEVPNIPNWYDKIIETNKNQFTSQNNIYADDEFFNTLKQERNRSNRTGQPFCLIVAKLTDNLSKAQQPLKPLLRPFIDELKTQFSSYVRKFDYFYIVNPDIIGILLINFKINDAQRIVEKALNNLCNRYDSLYFPDSLVYLKYISIHSYSLPDNEICRYIPLIQNKSFSRNPARSIQSTLDDDINRNWENFFIVLHEQNTIETGIFESPLFMDVIKEYNKNYIYRIFKRFIDILVSLVAIICLHPVNILIAFIIKLTSSGPLLFRQKRSGLCKVPFNFLKYRTMNQVEEQTHEDYVKKIFFHKENVKIVNTNTPFYKINSNPRITLVGKVLRKTSLDELPQLFNILNGDMSLVGPRPPILYDSKMYLNWHFEWLINTKPGITGMWQVHGRSRTTFDEMIRFDIYYSRHKSILLDLKIILKTFKAVLDGT